MSAGWDVLMGPLPPDPVWLGKIDHHVIVFSGSNVGHLVCVARRDGGKVLRTRCGIDVAEWVYVNSWSHYGGEWEPLREHEEWCITSGGEHPFWEPTLCRRCGRSRYQGDTR